MSVHEDIRDAVAAVAGGLIHTAASGTTPAVYWFPRVYVAETNTDFAKWDIPCLVASYDSAERDVGGTNERDVFAYPVLLSYYAKGTPNSTSRNGYDPTDVREILRKTFHMRRDGLIAQGITNVLKGEYNGRPVVTFDLPRAEDLSTVVEILVTARVARS